MSVLNKSVIDDIIKNWFPIVGILFIVTGMSYLFHEGVWQKLNETGRLILGFFTGLVFISSAYAIDKKSTIIADGVLGGGLLMLYLSLIYGSRFQSANTQALIPETWSLLIATLFTLGVAFFSYSRRSQYILLVGIMGGYLTPFFIGESGSFEQFIDDKGLFHYDLPLMAFLIYFVAINVAILFVSSRFFLRGIGLLNSLGLFIGTYCLAFFMGGEFPDNADNIAGFMILVVILHVFSMCINAKKFSKETDPYLVVGFLLPLAWFVLNTDSFLQKYIAGLPLSGLLLVCAAIYFSSWHFLRKSLHQDKHIALYLGGIIAIVLAVTKLHPQLNHLDGPLLSIIAMIFGSLYMLKPLIEREISFIIFAFFGVLLAFWHINELDLPNPGFFRGTTMVLIFCQLPFIFGFFMQTRENEHEGLIMYRVLSSYLACFFIVLLIFLDLIRLPNIPRSFLFLTLPAAITCYLGYKTADDVSKIKFIKTSLALSGLGFCSTFLIMIDRFNPFPSTIGLLSSPESMVGVSTIVIIFLLTKIAFKVRTTDTLLFNDLFDELWQFLLTLLLYVCMWSTVTYEVLASFNTFAVHTDGVKNFAITIWWACLGSYMIYAGVKNDEMINQKNIGFGLLSLTIFKILFIDLGHLNTNFKVFVFMLVGLMMLSISYIANKKTEE